MIFPIASRELRVASRHWSTYYGRMAVAVVSLAVLLYLLWLFRKIGTMPISGGYLLRIFAYIAFGFCAFAGLKRTSDSLAAEKREDTLGLLFLTHLTGWDIVLGKLLAHSLRVFYGLIGAIPVLSMLMLLGGMSGSEAVRVPVSLLNTLYLSLALGLLVSTFTRNGRTAMGISSAVMALLMVLPLLGKQLAEEYEWPALAVPFCLPSPSFALGMSFGSAFGLSTNFFWIATVTQFAMGTAGLVVSAYALPRTWQIKAEGPVHLIFKERVTQWLHGTGEERKKRRGDLLARNAILWLDGRDRFRPMWAVLFLAGLLGFTLWVVWYYEVPLEPALVFGFLACVIYDLFIKSRVAAIVLGRFQQDRQSGALEMILATPTSVPEIIRGCWMSLRQALLPGYVSGLVLYLIYAMTVLIRTDAQAQFYVLVFMALAVSLFDFVNCGWAAMWSALKYRPSDGRRNFGQMRVFILPWVLFAFSMPVLMQFQAMQNLAEITEGGSVMAFAFAIWAVNSIDVYRRTRRKVFVHFREAATDRFTLEEKIGWIPWLKRRLAIEIPRTGAAAVLK